MLKTRVFGEKDGLFEKGGLLKDRVSDEKDGVLKDRVFGEKDGLLKDPGF